MKISIWNICSVLYVNILISLAIIYCEIFRFEIMFMHYARNVCTFQKNIQNSSATKVVIFLIRKYSECSLLLLLCLTQICISVSFCLYRFLTSWKLYLQNILSLFCEPFSLKQNTDFPTFLKTIVLTLSYIINGIIVWRVKI